MAIAIERVRVRLPEAFDPMKHHTVLAKIIADKYGEGFEVEHIDPTARVAHASRQVITTEVTASAERTDSFDVRLARGTKPSDGDKVAAKLEDQNPGFHLTVFEPFLGRATLSRLSDAEARCRAAVAVAVSVKPWEVAVSTRAGGGFELGLPRTYVPSKHDEKLNEVATGVVGQLGWFVRTNPQKLTAELVPSAPPTFPPVIPAPLDRFGSFDHWLIPLGRDLPAPGEDLGEEVTLNFAAASYALLAGIPQSGKSTVTNGIIAGQLSAGSELVVLTTPEKSVDFLWCRDLVRDGGWGCDSLPAAVTALALVYQEGQRRAEILKEHGVVNWTELPPAEQFQPVLAVVDEYAALVTPEKVPGGIPKTHPIVQEALEINLLRAQLERWVSKITAEMRFVGLRMILSSQVTNASTGMPPSLKAKLGHRFLFGANPSKAARNQAFNDEQAVPLVPENIRADEAAARGVGTYESEGRSPAVCKAYYASTDDYRRRLLNLNVPVSARPTPTSHEIAMHTPALDDGNGEQSRPPSRLDKGGFGRPDGRDVAEKDRLTGAAAASHQLRIEAARGLDS